MKNNANDNLIKKSAYNATSESLESIKNEFPEYGDILACFEDGVKKAELRKRYMLRKIDEAWVKAVEDALPAIDTIIRKPSVFLQEKEEILPIELTRKVSGRSVEHLVQHTDLINEIGEDGMVYPSKLLNVYQDDTVLTYENKFLNTLLNRLYAFVSMRYDSAIENGADEKCTTLSFDQEFERGEKHGKIKVSLEISEPPKENEVVKNYVYTTDLWKRVEKIKNVVDGYMSSNFVSQMGRNFVHPPIMRTNKILKNVEFRSCMALWDFFDTYETTGYETLIEEDLENIDEKCIEDYYNTITAQYVLFEKHIENEFLPEQVLDRRTVDGVKPKIKNELDEFDEREYDFRDVVKNKTPSPVSQTGEEDLLEYALNVALTADDFYLEQEAEREKSILYRYRYSFLSRLILAQNPTQDFYTEIKNELLSYKNIKSRISWNHEIFCIGKNKCAKVNVKGKTLFLYLPLNPQDYADSKYHVKDVSDKKQFKDLPTLLKIKSNRAVKYAKELIHEVMQSLGIERLDNATYIDYRKKSQTLEQLLKAKLVKRIGESGKIDITEEREEVKKGILYRYRYSFLSRLILAQNPTGDYYTQVKNLLLSFEGVKDKTAWNYETYTYKKEKFARLNVKGKTLYLYLPLNPKDYADSKYHVKDVSDKKQYREFPVLLKIKSDRAVKYAKELIDISASGIGLKKDINAQFKNYRLKYQTVEQMLKRVPPLVKLISSTGEGASVKSSLRSPYRFSFEARIIQSDEVFQDLYGEIKNYLLSFNGIISKTSFGHESFKYKNKTLIKAKIRGKSLKLYMALSPDKVVNSKYNVKDMRNGKDTALPLLYKVKGKRTLLYAKELIDKVLDGIGAKRNPDYKAQNYRQKFLSTNTLIKQGKIKVADKGNLK